MIPVLYGPSLIRKMFVLGLRFIILQYCCSCRVTVSRVWNRRIQNGNTECRAGSQWSLITSSRENRHVTCVSLMYCAATSRTLSQELGSFARQQVSTQTVRRHESRFCLQPQDSRIRVWLHHGERTLAASIRHNHTGPSPGVIVWGAIGYTSRSPVVHIDGTLNSTRYISSVLQPMTLPLILALRNPTFQQDNARADVAGIIQTLLDTIGVPLLPWPTRSPDLHVTPLVHVYLETDSSPYAIHYG
ncbi:uncharacterized protein TNCV_27811 [Trichonephila clavipes]|uniref:Uncharacterized protein n=1 Tax=Trichonephila clavipes TaxID=2585209 RepID=A0A8X6WM74_TRICX|nr:uncharacterized protein TNCV_27811 [Trichonephila clavipes]